MSNAQDLTLHDRRIDAECGTDSECTCLTRAILTLGDQVMILSIDRLANEKDRHALDL